MPSGRLPPPLYDSPSTTGLVDERTGAVFTSDCFGGPLPDAEAALSEDVAAVPSAASWPVSSCGRRWTARG